MGLRGDVGRGDPGKAGHMVRPVRHSSHNPTHRSTSSLTHGPEQHQRDPTWGGRAAPVPAFSHFSINKATNINNDSVVPGF